MAIVEVPSTKVVPARAILSRMRALAVPRATEQTRIAATQWKMPRVMDKSQAATASRPAPRLGGGS